MFNFCMGLLNVFTLKHRIEAIGSYSSFIHPKNFYFTPVGKYCDAMRFEVWHSTIDLGMYIAWSMALCVEWQSKL